jgi:hypothetical protein
LYFWLNVLLEVCFSLTHRRAGQSRKWDERMGEEEERDNRKEKKVTGHEGIKGEG